MEEEIKLPGSSFEEVAKIIQAYAHLNKEVSLDDVSKQLGMHTTIVSRNNGFLASLGIITGGQKKQITPVGRQLGQALSHGLEPEVQSLLRQIVDQSEFMKNLVGAVRIRKGMDESALKSHVAYSAGQSKNPSAMTGAATVIEILKRSGAIEEVDGKFVATSSAQSATSDAVANTTVSGGPNLVPRISERGVRIVHHAADTGIAISIEVTVQCQPDDLDTLGAKLRKVIRDFEEEPAPSESEPDLSK